jgi:hypothetical protein
VGLPEIKKFFRKTPFSRQHWSGPALLGLKKISKFFCARQLQGITLFSTPLTEHKNFSVGEKP